MSAPPEDTPQTFAGRLRSMRNKRYEEYAHIAFGGPLGTFLSAVIANVGWLTPNLLTVVGLLARIAAAGLLLSQRHPNDVAAAILVLSSIVLDIMDGSIARYRRLASRFGSFLDKVSDSIAIFVFSAALAYRMWLDTADIRLVFVCFFIGSTLLFRRYIYWLRNYMFLDAEGKTSAPANPGLSDLSFGQRVFYYLKSSWRLVMVSESDIYVAISVALVVGHLPMVVWVAGAGVAPWFVVVVATRFVQVYRLDQP